MKQPSKIRLVVRASKRQPGIGLFDEVRVVLVKRERPVCKNSRNK
jgi:hypothetical protein